METKRPKLKIMYMLIIENFNFRGPPIMCTQEETSTSLKIPVKPKKSQSCQNCQPLSENKIQDKFIEDDIHESQYTIKLKYKISMLVTKNIKNIKVNTLYKILYDYIRRFFRFGHDLALLKVFIEHVLLVVHCHVQVLIVMYVIHLNILISRLANWSTWCGESGWSIVGYEGGVRWCGCGFIIVSLLVPELGESLLLASSFVKVIIGVFIDGSGNSWHEGWFTTAKSHVVYYKQQPNKSEHCICNANAKQSNLHVNDNFVVTAISKLLHIHVANTDTTAADAPDNVDHQEPGEKGMNFDHLGSSAQPNSWMAIQLLTQLYSTCVLVPTSVTRPRCQYCTQNWLKVIKIKTLCNNDKNLLILLQNSSSQGIISSL